MALLTPVWSAREWLKARLFDQHPKKALRLGKRLVDAATEIGVLLMVFGPLDALLRVTVNISATPAVGPSTAIWSGWTFFALGVMFVVVAMFAEWRLPDDS